MFRESLAGIPVGQWRQYLFLLELLVPSNRAIISILENPEQLPFWLDGRIWGGGCERYTRFGELEETLDLKRLSTTSSILQ